MGQPLRRRLMGMVVLVLALTQTLRAEASEKMARNLLAVAEAIAAR